MSQEIDHSSVYKFMKVHCKRMIQMIHFQLYSHIFALKSEQDAILKNDSVLSQVCDLQNFLVNTAVLKEAAKYRDLVFQSLVKDGWMDQGIQLLEQSRHYAQLLS